MECERQGQDTSILREVVYCCSVIKWLKLIQTYLWLFFYLNGPPLQNITDIRNEITHETSINLAFCNPSEAEAIVQVSDSTSYQRWARLPLLIAMRRIHRNKGVWIEVDKQNKTKLNMGNLNKRIESKPS